MKNKRMKSFGRRIMILGVIPARGGSKGILRKNIKEIAGKPLIAWTIDAAKSSKLLDHFKRVLDAGEKRIIVLMGKSADSMNKTGKFEDPEVVDAINKTSKSALKNNIIPGIHVISPDPDEVKKRIKERFKFIAVSIDSFMLSALAVKTLKKIEEL